MKKTVVCVFNDFKKTMTSAEANFIAEEYLRRRGFNVTSLFASDGGPGFLNTVPGEILEVETKDNLLNPIKVKYKLHGRHAFIETSLIMKDKDIWQSTTYGIGKIIIEAVKKGAQVIHLGLGGSLTNDGGLGILVSLGAKFYNHENTEISFPRLKDLREITRIDLSKVFLKKDAILVLLICDVMNPLLGKNGATAQFSAQKGAKKGDMLMLESLMIKLVQLLEKATGESFSSEKGMGAAGGIGLAIAHLFNYKIISGSDYFILSNKVIQSCDYILTGEGKYDSQSLLGKLPFRLKEAFPEKTVIIAGETEKSGFLIYDLVSSYGKKYSFSEPKNALLKKIKELYLTGVLKK